MNFSGVWRDYQERAIAEVETHLADDRIHVVAAPGSGKTILGLELMRRLSRPALILTPTRTIRDQWPARLVPLFLPEAPAREEISYHLDAPAAMTVTTYQALHAIWSDKSPERFAGLIAAMGREGPITVVLDEAHHLRREWWNALQALIDALPDARIVALTATPPYDAPFAEWTRYDDLCGPIDLEIGVPELVRNGDLCPHQDHVIFSAPQHEALALLDHRREHVAKIQSGLRADATLLDFFETHPWLAQPADHAEAILEAPEMLSAILIHLAASGRKLPGPPLDLLGVGSKDIPAPSDFWFEILLNGLLFRMPEAFPIGSERSKSLRASLHEQGLIEGGRVKLRESRHIFTLMAGSLAKLDSITAIARAETDNLGSELRLVVLSDHVRAGELPRAADADYGPGKLGVVPIFETLRRAGLSGQAIGILTGTLIILPDSACGPLREMARSVGLAEETISFAPLPFSPGFSVLEAGGEGDRHAVALVTALFAAGHVNILIGTQALLGEGWDAPVTNSLVLASNSAAFMLSNQMRGRAIRLDPRRPDKVANIWHLATVEALPSDGTGQWRERLDWGRVRGDENAGSDLDLLQRRFLAFQGISNGDSLQIESGLERLRLFTGGSIEAANRRSFDIARDRTAVAAGWRRSLGDAASGAHVRETASPNYAPRRLSWYDTLQWFAASALSSGAFAAANSLRQAEGMAGLGALAMAATGVATLAALPKLWKAGRLLFRNGSLEGSLAQVGRAVLIGLHHSAIVPLDEWDGAMFEVHRNLSGRVDLVVHGVSRASERAIMESIAEILGPVGNPRYLLVRRTWLSGVRRADYHAVPSLIARNKASAEAFHRAWRDHVGSSRLVFTRTAEGRVMLLKARARSFAAGFQRAVDRRSAWL